VYDAEEEEWAGRRERVVCGLRALGAEGVGHQEGAVARAGQGDPRGSVFLDRATAAQTRRAAPAGDPGGEWLWLGRLDGAHVGDGTALV